MKKRNERTLKIHVSLFSDFFFHISIKIKMKPGSYSYLKKNHETSTIGNDSVGIKYISKSIYLNENYTEIEN